MEAVMRSKNHRALNVAALAVATLVLLCPAAFGTGRSEGDITVLVDGDARPEYVHRGILYVEALRGSDYTLRLTNPTPHRVAVALSVDGLNTIDARHSDAFSASKWVLDPYESAEIAGWQVNQQTARRFVFTGERDSYGAAIGITKNLGVIEAVFYRERPRRVDVYVDPQQEERSGAARDSASGQAPPSAAIPPQSKKQNALSDDYAATGMGGRKRHEVQRVFFDIDPQPIASVRIRYEFRPQLVKLGVLDGHPSPLERRERARGFDGFCPEPE
jgi:hypothetical protein